MRGQSSGLENNLKNNVKLREQYVQIIPLALGKDSFQEAQSVFGTFTVWQPMVQC